MQDTSSNKLVDVSQEVQEAFGLVDAEPVEEEIRRRIDASGKIVTADQGPIFEVGKVYPIQGYGYELVRIKRNGLVFKPHGPISPPADE